MLQNSSSQSVKQFLASVYGAKHPRKEIRKEKQYFSRKTEHIGWGGCGARAPGARSGN